MISGAAPILLWEDPDWMISAEAAGLKRATEVRDLHMYASINHPDAYSGWVDGTMFRRGKDGTRSQSLSTWLLRHRPEVVVAYRISRRGHDHTESHNR